MRHLNPDRDKLAREAIEFLRDEYTDTKDLKPSPAALAAATRLTEEIFLDVNALACFLDGIAQEARENERKRIFAMSAREIFAAFWNNKKLYRKTI